MSEIEGGCFIHVDDFYHERLTNTQCLEVGEVEQEGVFSLEKAIG